MVRKKARAPEGFLTVGEAAAELGVTAATLRNWDRAGKLTPHRHPVNGYRLYRRQELKELLQKITGQKGESDV
jgi:excisionase family DNA binding protein